MSVISDKYMVSVEGRDAPKKVYDNVMAATKEANRLAELNLGKVVSVLMVVREYRARVFVADYNREDEPF